MPGGPGEEEEAAAEGGGGSVMRRRSGVLRSVPKKPKGFFGLRGYVLRLSQRSQEGETDRESV